MSYYYLKKYSFNEDRKSTSIVIDRLSNNVNLSEWEKGFIKNIKYEYDFGKPLTVKQLEKLSDLWSKY